LAPKQKWKKEKGGRGLSGWQMVYKRGAGRFLSGWCSGRNAFGLINGKPSAVELAFCDFKWTKSHIQCTLNSMLVLSPALWRRATVDVAVARGHATLLYDS